MNGIALLWQIYALLPLVFALDVAAFHLSGDHPLAARWWWGRSADRKLPASAGARSVVGGAVKTPPTGPSAYLTAKPPRMSSECGAQKKR